MTLPALLFGFVVAGFAGSVFHLVTGGTGTRLVVYLLAAVAGFWLGHAAGVGLGWNFLNVGPLRFGMGLIGCLVMLGIGYWLSQVRAVKP